MGKSDYPNKKKTKIKTHGGVAPSSKKIVDEKIKKENKSKRDLLKMRNHFERFHGTDSF